MRATILVVLASTLLPAIAAVAKEPTAQSLVARKAVVKKRLPFTSLSQLSRAQQVRMAEAQSTLAATEERPKGVGQDIYPRVAPATVLVRTRFGHGTGFFVHEDGWLVTNRHVVADADYSADRGGQVVQVYLGVLGSEGWMQVVNEPIPGLVYRTSLRQDLALVKLLDLPADQGPKPFIELADDAARPGSDCVAIGHPTAGTLWTLRSGEIAGGGMFPGEVVDQIMFLMSVDDVDRPRFEQALAGDPERRRVVISTCGINPGDSGGPLVDKEGRLVGVTYAIPAFDLQVLVDRAKFTYHIDVSEVREFLSDWPSTPNIEPPNPLAAGAHYGYADQDEDDYYETMFVYETNAEGAQPIGIHLDLDGDSFGGQSVEELEESEPGSEIGVFDFEFAVCLAPRTRVSYDTDNDGRIDLAFSDENGDGVMETRFEWHDGKFALKQATGEPIDGEHFADKKLQDRFTELNAVQ